MPEQSSNPSSQSFQGPSADDFSSHREDGTDALRNSNGKRSLDDLQEDQVDAPRKSARLDVDNSGGRDEIQRPSNPVASTSNPNQEYEFVDGPGHIAFIEERGKLCPALCFNDLLFSRFTKIAMTSREMREKDGQLRKAELELERIKSSTQTASIEKAKRIVEEAIETQKELEAEVPELVEAQRRCDSFAREKQSSKKDLDLGKEIARYMIEDILDRANLLQLPTSKPRELIEVKEHHWANPASLPEKTVHDATNAETSNVPERSPEPSTTRLETPTNIEKQPTPRQIALRHLRFAAEELDDANRHFAYMQEEYAQEVAAEIGYRREQYPDRPESFTQTDIDLKCLQKQQKVTREVIEAEEAYDRAEQDAENLGLGDILADPRACYWGEIHNNFSPPIVTSSSMSPLDRARIEAWMASIPDSVAVGPQNLEVAELAEVDEWEAKSVEVFESISLVAYDMYRKKIDKWQELSSHLRQEKVKESLPRTGR